MQTYYVHEYIAPNKYRLLGEIKTDSNDPQVIQSLAKSKYPDKEFIVHLHKRISLFKDSKNICIYGGYEDYYAAGVNF